jgi:hypothetical protein
MVTACLRQSPWYLDSGPSQLGREPPGGAAGKRTSNASIVMRSALFELEHLDYEHRFGLQYY